MDQHSWTTVKDVATLRALVGVPVPRVANKVRTSLHDLDRQWLAASPFCLVATSGADGSCDVSPKGDPSGVAVALDEVTIALPDRPGNRRVDGFLNLLANPAVGLLFLVPGRGDTLRINGRAELVSEAPFFDELIVKGHRPTLAMVVRVEEIFYHCSKAFLRSGLWDAGSWDPESVPPRATIAHTLERPEDSAEEVAKYYGAGYNANLYG